MAHLPYRPEHINDAIANAEELTNEELGAFTRLLWALWRAGGYLPDDSKKLARFARAGSRWGTIAPAVMAKLTVIGGKVSCADLLTTLMLTEQRRARAAGAANVRYGKADRGLNSCKPLKSLSPTSVLASSEHVLGGCNQNQNQDRESFYDAAAAILVKRVGLRTLAARSQIARWLSGVGGSEDAVQTMLNHAVAENLEGSRLVAVVDQMVKTCEREAKFGQPLPFPLKAISKVDG